MTAPLTIYTPAPLNPNDAAAIASLPARLRLTRAGPADIVIVAADAASIVEGLELKPQAIVVSQPALLDESAMALLEKADCPIFPALLLARRLADLDLGDSADGASLVRSHLASTATAQDGITEHLGGLEALLGPLQQARLSQHDGQTYAGTARTRNGVLVCWSGINGAAFSALEVDLVSPSARAEIRGLLDASARPLRVCTADAGGASQRNGVYETAHRLYWRELVAALQGTDPRSQWRAFASVHALARNVLAQAPATQ